MNTHVDKTEGNKSQSGANAISRKSSSAETAFRLVDNRPEAVVQRKLQEMANNSLQAERAFQLQTIIDNHSSKRH